MAQDFFKRKQTGNVKRLPKEITEETKHAGKFVIVYNNDEEKEIIKEALGFSDRPLYTVKDFE